jgi:Gas vesicle protein
MVRTERQHHRAPTAVDIIDRVLDKGVVIEYHGRISVGGIDTLVTVDARYVAASIDTHQRYEDLLRSAGIIGRGVPRFPRRTR